MADEVVEGFGVGFVEDVDDVPFGLEDGPCVDDVVDGGGYQRLIDFLQQ